MKLRVEPKFKALFRAQTPQERQLLEEDIEKNGILEPIRHWKGTIVDGMNRYEIAEAKGLSFPQKPMDFDSEEDAIRWIVRNQLGRRNLTPGEHTYLLGKHLQADLSDGKTLYEAAKQNTVPYNTAKRAIATAEKIDKLPEKEKAKVLRSRARPHVPNPSPPPPEPISGEHYPVHLADVVKNTTLRQCVEAVEHVKKEVLRATNGLEGAWLSMGPIKVALDQAAELLKSALYYSVCPECCGKRGGCDECRRSGWMPKFRYDELHGAPGKPAVPNRSRRGVAS